MELLSPGGGEPVNRVPRPTARRGWLPAGRTRRALGLGLALLCPMMLVPSEPARHRLLEGSFLVDDCPPCGRPTLPQRLRGTHQVRPVAENPLFTRYALSDIDWQTHDASGEAVRITGSGELTWGGEVALVQEVRLHLNLATRATHVVRHFTNSTPFVTRPWPNLAVDLTAEEATFTQVFHLSLRSIPLRDLWFTTAHGFTPGRDPVLPRPPGSYRPAGDVLSIDGRVVLPNEALTGGLGLMPPTPPLALDAFDQAPGARSVFSLRDPVFSETLGDLPSGTLLIRGGGIFRRLKELLAPFQPTGPWATDPGLDAVQVLDDGEILFSTVTDVPTERGRLGHGDVLGSNGEVRHRLPELLAPFQPQPLPGGGAPTPGLDALHVWPHGEVWFSVAEGFASATLGFVQAGDLLSSGGWRVFGNLELLEQFAPLEDLADFGLTSARAITDVSPPPAPARLRNPAVAADVALSWAGAGRVHQVEHSPGLGQPFVPATPLLPCTNAVLPAAAAPGWYRVRSW
ncbi:MAG: hypothetical protein ACKO3N_12450 [Verrucomicrobiota bacterium]